MKHGCNWEQKPNVDSALTLACLMMRLSRTRSMTSDTELVKDCQPVMNGLNRQSNKPWLSGLETENEAGPEKTSAEKRIRPFYRYSQPLSRAIRAASIRLFAPSLLMASEM